MLTSGDNPLRSIVRMGRQKPRFESTLLLGQELDCQSIFLGEIQLALPAIKGGHWAFDLDANGVSTLDDASRQGFGNIAGCYGCPA